MVLSPRRRGESAALKTPPTTAPTPTLWFTALPESIVAHVLEHLAARELGRGVARASKCLHANAEVVALQIVQTYLFGGTPGRAFASQPEGSSESESESSLGDAHAVETRAFAFDGLSDEAFSPLPRRGAWLECWRARLRLCVSAAARREYDYRAYRPRPCLTTPTKKTGLSRVRGAGRIAPVDVAPRVISLDAAVALPLDAARALVGTSCQGGRAIASAAVICCPSTLTERSVMQHANFFGPAQRWVPLHRLVDELDYAVHGVLTTAPPGVLRVGAACGCALVKRGDDFRKGRPGVFVEENDDARDDADGDDGDDPDLLGDRDFGVVRRVRLSLDPGDYLLFPHHQFLKLKRLLADDDDVEDDGACWSSDTFFGIPDDMSIFMGGHGTTPAVVLLSLTRDTLPEPVRRLRLYGRKWPRDIPLVVSAR